MGVGVTPGVGDGFNVNSESGLKGLNASACVDTVALGVGLGFSQLVNIAVSPGCWDKAHAAVPMRSSTTTPMMIRKRCLDSLRRRRSSRSSLKLRRSGAPGVKLT